MKVLRFQACTFHGDPSVSSFHSQFQDALKHAENMLLQGISLSKNFLLHILEMSIENSNLVASRQVHSFIVGGNGDHAPFLDDRLLHVFSNSSSLFEANLVFCQAKKLDSHTWHGIISAYASFGSSEFAIQLYSEMHGMGIQPSKLTFLCILRICGQRVKLAQAFFIHDQIVNSKFGSDILLRNALIDAYMKCGSFRDAQTVIRMLHVKDVVPWNAMIAGYAKHGLYISAFDCFKELLQEGLEPTNRTFSCVLNVCGALDMLREGRLVHEFLLKAGIHIDTILTNALIDMYARCGSLQDAWDAFENFPERDVVSWSAMIGGCAQNGDDIYGLQLFLDMQKQCVVPDRVCYINVLQACGNVGAIQEGMWIHEKIVKCNYESDIVAGSSLISMFSRCGCLHEARKVFDGLQSRNLVSWNALISGYVEYNQASSAIMLFERMIEDRIEPNEVTLMYMLKACGDINVRDWGSWTHDKVVRNGFESDILIEISLIDMYITLGCLDGAQRVFDMISDPSSCIWNAIITGYAGYQHGYAALDIFQDMQMKGPRPDEVTFSAVVKICSNLDAVVQGKLLYDYIIKSGVNLDVFLGNSLINMYMEFGYLREAQHIFESLPARNVASWNSMVAGFSRHQLEISAIELFQKLQKEENVQPDKVTFLIMLQTCCDVGALEQGKLTHDLILKNCLETDPLIECALVYMYAKSSALDSVWKLFHSISSHKVSTWGAIISGYALHGSLMIIEQCIKGMECEGIRLDEQIYTSILAACSHSGLIERGYEYFKAMQVHHCFLPTIEHYNCMVDLFCRAGHLVAAKEILCTMECLPDASGWMSLFTACRIYGNQELANHCFNQAVSLYPELAVGYGAMSDILTDDQT